METDFDHLCNGQTQWIALKKGLDKLKTYKEELLICLNYPATPLYNNQSERDIREQVKKRKISGSTRSPNGRKARDAIASLKKRVESWTSLLGIFSMTD
ncbi:MAG: transposase [Bacteroidota bacterium]